MGARHTYAEAFCFTLEVTIIPTKKEYVKLWVSYKEYFEPLADDAIGRLVRAMIEYKAYGESPELDGDERFVWPAIKRDIDESIKANEDFSRKQSENGKKGGRPKKQTVIAESQEKPKNPSLFSESQKTYGLRTMDYGLGTMDKGIRTKANIIPPTVEEVIAYAETKLIPKDFSIRFYDYYDAGDWIDSEGKPVRSWKQKLTMWWTKELDKQKKQQRHDDVKKANDRNRIPTEEEYRMGEDFFGGSSA